MQIFFWCCNASLDEKMTHHLRIECVAPLGWARAFLVEDLGYFGAIMTVAAEIGRTSNQVNVSTECL
jgi:hypothetical protein